MNKVLGRLVMAVATLALLGPPVEAGGGKGGFGGGLGGKGGIGRGFSGKGGSFRVGSRPGGSKPSGDPHHGNSKSSTRPQHLYAITKTDKVTGKTTIEKFGVSGGKTKPGVAREHSDRAVGQVRKLNRESQAKEDGRYSYRQRILQRAPNRNEVLTKENDAVQAHRQARGFKPPRNIRP